MKFTDAQKKVIVARREKGESVRSLCSEFNIPRSTLYRWCKSHKVDIIANGTPFTAREINQMQNRQALEDIPAWRQQDRDLMQRAAEDTGVKLSHKQLRDRDSASIGHQSTFSRSQSNSDALLQ